MMCSRSVSSDPEVIRTLSGSDVIRTLSADAVAGSSTARPAATVASRTPAATLLIGLIRLFNMRQPCTAPASPRLHRVCRALAGAVQQAGDLRGFRSADVGEGLQDDPPLRPCRVGLASGVV